MQNSLTLTLTSVSPRSGLLNPGAIHTAVGSYLCCRASLGHRPGTLRGVLAFTARCQQRSPPVPTTCHQWHELRVPVLLFCLYRHHSSEPHQPQAAGTRLKHVAHPPGATPHPNPFQVLELSASQSLGQAGESCSIRGDHTATPSPASPPNAPASLGSPGHRAAWWPEARDCVPPRPRGKP